MVSHDRYFMDKIVDHLFVLEGDGQCIDFNGDYSEYRQLAKEKLQILKREEKVVAQQSKEVVQKPSLITFEQRKEINKVEKEISEIGRKKETNNERF